MSSMGKALSLIHIFIVWDNHGSGVNLDYDLLDARCRIALGSGWQHRWPLLDESCDGVLMVGYHPCLLYTSIPL